MISVFNPPGFHSSVVLPNLIYFTNIFVLTIIKVATLISYYFEQLTTLTHHHAATLKPITVFN